VLWVLQLLGKKKLTSVEFIVTVTVADLSNIWK